MASYRRAGPHVGLCLAVIVLALLALRWWIFLVPAVICAVVAASMASKRYCVHCGAEVYAPGGCLAPATWLGIFLPESTVDQPRIAQCTLCEQWGCWRCCHPHGERVRQMPIFDRLSDGALRIADWATFTEASDFRHHECCDCGVAALGREYLKQQAPPAAPPAPLPRAPSPGPASAAAPPQARGPAAPPAQAAAEAPVDVVIVSLPALRMGVTRVLNEERLMSPGDAAKALQKLPVVVARNVAGSEAERLQRLLHYAGAGVELRPTTR